MKLCMNILCVFVLHMLIERCSSRFNVKSCGSEIHVNKNSNLDLAITCETSEKYYRCQIRENYDEKNYDMCIFKMDPRIGLTKPHCTKRLFRTKLYWKYEQTETSCKIKILNVGNPENLGSLTMFFKRTRFSDKWIKRQIEMESIHSTINQLNRSAAEQGNVFCDEIKVGKLSNYGAIYSDISGIYNYQIKLLGKPVFKKYENINKEIYLYWRSRENAWVFSPGIGSNNIWASSICDDSDPRKCKDWNVQNQISPGISIECHDPSVSGSQKENLAALLPRSSLDKGVNKISNDIDLSDQNPNQDIRSNKSTMYGLIGGCISLFSITIIVGVFFSRRKKFQMEKNHHGSASVYRKSFVEFYLKYHLEHEENPMT